MPAQRGSLASATVLVSALAAVSTAIGLGRDVVIAGVFGSGASLDAYFLALGLMNVVLGLLAGGVVKASVPVFARQAADAGEDAPLAVSRTASIALSGLLVVLGAASLAVYVAVVPLTGWVGPGFDPEQSALAARLTRVLLVAVLLVAATNLLAAIAQAHRRFFWAAAEGVPFNVVMIAAAAGFGPRYGVTALAVGFVVGSALRLVCQLPALRGLGLRLRLPRRWDDAGAREIAYVLPPLLLGSAVTNVNTLVDRAVGSLVGEGVISSLSYGWRLTSLADTLVTASLVTVAYPAFGAAAARLPELARLLDRALRTVVTVLLPIVVVLMIASEQVVALVYERGSFSAQDTSTTATAVLFYAPTLAFVAWRELVVRASYALGDTRRPVAVAVLAMVLNVIGDLTLGRHFGIAGLAASTTVAVLVAAVVNSWWLARQHGIAGLAAVAGSLWRVGCAGAACACALAAAVAVAPDPGTSTVGRLGLLSALSLVTAVSYWTGLVLLRAPERALVGYTLSLVAGRLTRAGR